jgi:hypothetical protein
MMKKALFFVMVALVAMTIAGCDKDEERPSYETTAMQLGGVEPAVDEDSPLEDPTAEEANAANCVSFAGLKQWWGSDGYGSKSEKEAAFLAAFNSDFRRYPDLNALFEHVEPGTGGSRAVSFTTQSYSEFLKSSKWSAVWNTYYSPADKSYHQQKKVGGFDKAGYNIPADDRVVGTFGFDLDGDGKADKVVHALLECFNILTEREVIKSVPKPKPVPIPTPAPEPTPTPEPNAEIYYSLRVKYLLDGSGGALRSPYETKTRKGTAYDLSSKTTLNISGYYISRKTGDTALVSSKSANQNVEITVWYKRSSSGGGGGGSGSGSGGGGNNPTPTPTPPETTVKAPVNAPDNRGQADVPRGNNPTTPVVLEPKPADPPATYVTPAPPATEPNTPVGGEIPAAEDGAALPPVVQEKAPDAPAGQHGGQPAD